jgi:uncharacterized glyoxalase superfamily protein PhnB
MMSNPSMPPGTLIPELTYPDLDAAVDWLTRVFGFRQRLRIGSHRAQMLLDDTTSFVAVQGHAAPAGHSLMVAVPDVDAHFARVQRAGARVVNPPASFPFGERQYTVEDPTGRRWTFSQSVADVDPAAWGGQLR